MRERICFCDPHRPQETYCVWLSPWPGEHTPWAVHPPTLPQEPQLPHEQDPEQVRERDCTCVPQFPHATGCCWVSVCPAPQVPWLAHEPTFCQLPQLFHEQDPEQVRLRDCCCCPQYPQVIHWS